MIASSDEEQAQKAAEEQAPNAAALQKIKDLRAKIQAKATAEGKDIKDLTTQEYRDAMLEGLPEEQKKAQQSQETNTQKINEVNNKHFNLSNKVDVFTSS